MATPYSTAPPPTPPIQLNPLLIIIRAVVLLPALLLMRAAGISASTDSTSEFIDTHLSGPDLVECQHRLDFNQQSSAKRRLLLSLSALASLAATLVVPTLRSATLLGSPLPKWALLATVLFCGRNFIHTSLTQTQTLILLEPCFQQSRRWAYYANGLTSQSAAAIHSGCVLLAWRCLGFTASPHPLTHYATWIVILMLLKAALTLVNTAAVMIWKAKAIYDILEQKILKSGFHISILNTILHSSSTLDLNSLVPWRRREGEFQIAMLSGYNGSGVDVVFYGLEDYIRVGSTHKVTTLEIRVIAEFMQAYTMMLPEERREGSIGEEVRICRGIAPGDSMEIGWTWLRERLGLNEEDARVLYGELRGFAGPSEQVSYYTFQTYMDHGYEENLELGRSLCQLETELVNAIRVAIAIIITEAFLVWLFFTQQSTTKVSVVIPFILLARILILEIIIPGFLLLMAYSDMNYKFIPSFINSLSIFPI